MRACGYRRGLAHCDRPFGHDGPHRDDWVMSEPMEFETAPTDQPDGAA